MKTTFNNSELCHVWASQSQSTGKGNSLSFEGTKLLSFNWYTIGMFINNDTVLIRKGTYSSSTSKHQSYMNRAIGSHIKQITVEYLPDYNYTGLTSFIHGKNINSFVKGINNFLPSFNAARTNKEYIYRNYLNNCESLIKYCNLFELTIPELPVIDVNYIESEISKVETKRKEKEEKELQFYNFLKENSTQALQELKTKWLNDETNDTAIYHSAKNKQRIYFPIEETLLRLKGDSVQTSHGANVPLRESKILYDMIQAGKDIKGFRIGNYTVIGINGVLTIGCHKIERTEIERFARLMNW